MNPDIRAQVMAQAARAYCTTFTADSNTHWTAELEHAHHALLAAHDATSPTPRRYTVISIAQLAWQAKVIDLAEVVAQEHGYLTEARAALRSLLANPPTQETP